MPPLDGLPGIEVERVEDDHLRCVVTGPIQPLLDALGGTSVLKIDAREPSLEELFLRYYGTDA